MSAPRMRLGAICLAAAVGLSTAAAFSGTPESAAAFGTVNNPGIHNHQEHEFITRAALACAPGVLSTGNCFEPRSMAQLAGRGGSFGGVGYPDFWEFLGTPQAHCDGADYLDVPGYRQSRTQANAALAACIAYMRQNMTRAVDAAGVMLDHTGVEVVHGVDLTSDCAFRPGVLAETKCGALLAFGRLLHTAQDFYSHSNWTDQSAAGPVSPANPPGLNLPAPSRLMNLEVMAPLGQPQPPVVLRPEEAGFTTGKYDLGSDSCKPSNKDVKHACLNKDSAIVNGITGVVSRPDDGDGPTFSVRGEIGGNEQRAVTAAIAETRRQFDYFQRLLIKAYGETDGRALILALTQDVVKIDLVFVIDTTGSMGSYINSVVADADSLVDVLTAKGPNGRLTDFRIGLVDYKDVDCTGCGSSYDAVTDLPFSTDRTAIVNALHALPGKVSGGGDTPEDMLSGLQRAVEFPWRPGVQKVIIQMGDAPGHDPENHSSLTSQKVGDAALAVDPAMIFPVLVGGSSATTAFVTALANHTGGRTISTSGGVGPALVKALQDIVEMGSTDDTNAPKVTTSLADPPAGTGGYARTTVTGTVTATDPSGVTKIECVDSAGGLTLGPLVGAGTPTASRKLTVKGDGMHQVFCTATDAAPAPHTGAAADSSAVDVALIDTHGPTLGCGVSPTVLQPADRRLIPVTATVTITDDASGPGEVKLISVANSKADSGDGDVQGFAVGTADTAGELRADPGPDGRGRLYTLTYEGKDIAGNAARCTVAVAAAAADGSVPTASPSAGSHGPTPSARDDGHLPTTGSRTGRLALAGGGILLAGILLTVAAFGWRRMRRLRESA